MIRLILVRHASTNDNHNKRLSGYIDSNLSEKAKYEISSLEKFLEDEKIDEIYSTPSSRTKETIKGITKNNNLKLVEVEELKELSFGDFEGMTFKEIKNSHEDEFEKMIRDGYKYRYPNGESLIDSYNRVSNKINMILKDENNNKTILICAHAGTIRNILSHLISNSFEYHWNFKIDNCSVSIIEIENRFAVIHMINNTQFLKNIT